MPWHWIRCTNNDTQTLQEPWKEKLRPRMKWFQSTRHTQTDDAYTKLQASGIAMLQKQKSYKRNDIRKIEDRTSISMTCHRKRWQTCVVMQTINLVKMIMKPNVNKSSWIIYSNHRKVRKQKFVTTTRNIHLIQELKPNTSVAWWSDNKFERRTKSSFFLA